MEQMQFESRCSTLEIEKSLFSLFLRFLSLNLVKHLAYYNILVIYYLVFYAI